jgi:hypothetical protein
MKRIIFIAISMILLFPLLSFAIQVTVDLEKVKPEEAAAILQAKKVSENPAAALPQPDVVEKYAKMGAEIGMALKEVCKTLSVEANDFVKTPVGMTVAGLIVYKYFGKDIIKLLLMFILCFTVTIFNTISLYWWIAKKKVVTEINEKVKKYDYIPRYDFKNDDSRGFCVGCHVFIYIVIGICSLSTVISL